MHRGYDTYGVGFAEKTIANIRTAVPKLNAHVTDVHQLPFGDNFFDGFEPITREMFRVLKPESFFATVPYEKKRTLSPKKRKGKGS